MSGRLALVIGSECAVLPPLGFIGPLATEMYAKLRELGGWRSATVADGPLLNPTLSELVSAVDLAFDHASKQQATLLISFIGHGRTTAPENFYLLPRDTPDGALNVHNAFHLAQEIQERLVTACLDGLIVLVDACETEQGVRAAARRWPEASGPDGRMELLVAAGDGPTYSGCFTRTIITMFDKGVPHAGEGLLPSDLVQSLKRCIAIEPRAFSYTAGVRMASSDPGLWLVPNAARRDDAVTGRAAAGFIDQLINGLVITESVSKRLVDVVNAGSHRLRGIVGPAGCGKSTLLATLIRPGWADALSIPAGYITAAVFLDVASSIESLTAELAVQLGARLDGFKAATRMVEHELAGQDSVELDAFTIRILKPLIRVGADVPVNIVIDGLDQPEPGSRDLLLAAVSELTRHPELGYVRLIVGIREGTGTENANALSHMQRIELPAPTSREIAMTVAATRGHIDDRDWSHWVDRILDQTPVGGWLLARLLIEVNSDVTAEEITQGIGLDTVVRRRVRDVIESVDAHTAKAVSAVLSVLVAAGAGPVLPLELFESALAALGIGLSTNRIRDVVVRLGALVSRGRPGTAEETLGLAHDAFQRPLELFSPDLKRLQANWALAAAIEGSSSPAAVGYARGSAVRHYLAYGDSSAAIAFLLELETPRATDNRDQWAAWLPSFVAVLGRDHPDTLTARNHLAFWRGECGELDAAIEEHRQILTARARILGMDHPDTLTTRSSLARWRAESGDHAGAIAELEVLLVDRTRVLGPDHRQTLITRHNLARWRGERGDRVTAITQFQELLGDRHRVLGPDHRDTLRTRQNLAQLLGENGSLATAIRELKQLLADQQRVLGSDHPHTFTTQHNLARLHGESGDLATAILEFQELLADQQRILGPDHPQSLTTRTDIARWHGESGDHGTAIAEFLELLADQQRILGDSHPNTLRTRSSIAYWYGERGDHATAISQFRELLADQRRILGPDHPHTLRARHDLAHIVGVSGHYVTAVTEYEQLLPDMRRVLGPDYPDTLKSREELAYWRGESGHVVAAITDYEQLLADRQRILGPDHPDTLRTRHYLAYWRGESGRPALAVEQYERLLRHQERWLGPDHPETLRTRHNLAFFTGETGKPATAVTQYEQLLRHQRRVLGPDHPDTLRTWHHLAHWRGEIGRATMAVVDYEQLLPVRLRVLGPDHPDTLRTRQNLARWRGETGRAAAAVADYEVLLADRQRLLGPEHHDTLATRHHLAYYHGRNGNLAAALLEYERLLPIRLRVLGPDHPDTLRTRHNLAYHHGENGDTATAVVDLELVLADRQCILGHDHPNTLRTRQFLGYYRGKVAGAAAAVAELEQVLADELRVLGPDHRYTLATRHDLAQWRAESGDTATAIIEYEQLLADQQRILDPTHPDTRQTERRLEILRAGGA